jgi:hypothetical protein
MQGGTRWSEAACVRITDLLDHAATAKLPLAGCCRELSTMAHPASDLPNGAAVYLVEEDLGHLGRVYLETDATEADRETIIRNFISGQYSNPIRVVAFNIGEGWSRDVSEDIANDVLDRAYDADETLTDSTKRFIDRYVTAGEKRPLAPSVPHEADWARRRASGAE